MSTSYVRETLDRRCSSSGKDWWGIFRNPLWFPPATTRKSNLFDHPCFMWDENKSQRHPFLSWNRSNEVTRKFFHYCFLGGDSNRGRSPRSHRNDWPRSFLWGNELGLHQTSQSFCSRGHSLGYACLIKRRPRFGARSLWRNWDPSQRGCRKPISRFIKEPIDMRCSIDHFADDFTFLSVKINVCSYFTWPRFTTIKTLLFNFHVSFYPFVPTRCLSDTLQELRNASKKPSSFHDCEQSNEHLLLWLPKTMIYWGFREW